MQRGITQTSSSHPSPASLPCNFSVECPTHPPHITALPLTRLRLPEKHCMPRTCTATWPKYTDPRSLPLPACSDTQHAALHVIRVCVSKCFAWAPYNISSSSSPPSSSCESGRKASIIPLTITTWISICWPQMSRRAAVWLRSQRAPEEKGGSSGVRRPRGRASGDLLPTQGPALSTPAHTRLQRHTGWTAALPLVAAGSQMSQGFSLKLHTPTDHIKHTSYIRVENAF